MKVERTYDDSARFLDLFMPLVYSEMDTSEPYCE